jgi:L-threonylcarbamoyladenylate synthase
MSIISKDIAKAVQILSNDGIISIPTETVYGLAGSIYSKKAIKKIFALKERPFFNPLIVHIHSTEQLADIVEFVPEKAQLLADAFWPGSLTLVLKKKSIIPDLVTAGKDTVAVRIPNHPVTLELLRQTGFPLAAPSANPFGCISPTQSTHVSNYFQEKLSMVLEGGSCQNGIESTIIGFENDEPILYRLGSISIEEITKVVGKVQIKNKKEKTPDAPGMLSRHYAPQTTTYLVNDAATFIKDFPNQKIGVLLFDKTISAANISVIKMLSSKSDLKEAASQLYASLHHLDTFDLDMIVAQKFPDYGLGQSINDRLERATKKA